MCRLLTCKTYPLPPDSQDVFLAAGTVSMGVNLLKHSGEQPQPQHQQPQPHHAAPPDLQDWPMLQVRMRKEFCCSWQYFFRMWHSNGEDCWWRWCHGEPASMAMQHLQKWWWLVWMWSIHHQLRSSDHCLGCSLLPQWQRVSFHLTCDHSKIQCQLQSAKRQNNQVWRLEVRHSWCQWRDKNHHPNHQPSQLQPKQQCQRYCPDQGVRQLHLCPREDLARLLAQHKCGSPFFQIYHLASILFRNTPMRTGQTPLSLDGAPQRQEDPPQMSSSMWRFLQFQTAPAINLLLTMV